MRAFTSLVLGVGSLLWASAGWATSTTDDGGGGRGGRIYDFSGREHRPIIERHDRTDRGDRGGRPDAVRPDVGVRDPRGGAESRPQVGREKPALNPMVGIRNPHVAEPVDKADSAKAKPQLNPMVAIRNPHIAEPIDKADEARAKPQLSPAAMIRNPKAGGNVESKPDRATAPVKRQTPTVDLVRPAPQRPAGDSTRTDVGRPE